MADENEEVRPCNLTETREEFYDDDVVIVDSLLHNTAKMPAKDCLPQNVLSGRIAPRFDPSKTSENAYNIGDLVFYQGGLYRFKNIHYGGWSSGDAELVDIKSYEMFEVTAGNVSNWNDLDSYPDNSNVFCNNTNIVPQIGNLPFPSSFVVTTISAKNDRKIQICAMGGVQRIFIRRKWSSSWSDWFSLTTETSIAPHFSASSSYKAGTLCTFQGTLKRALQDLAAGAFDSTKWEDVNLTNSFQISVNSSNVSYYNDLNTYPDNTFITCVDSDILSQISNLPKSMMFYVYTFRSPSGGKLQFFTGISNEIYVRRAWADSNWGTWSRVDVGAVLYNTFSSSSSYRAGTKLLYNGVLYKANKNVSAGAWNASDWDVDKAFDVTRVSLNSDNVQYFNDANSFPDNSFISCVPNLSSSISNLPAAASFACFTFMSSNTVRLQILFTQDGVIYMRSSWGTTWKPWLNLSWKYESYGENPLMAFSNILCIGDSLTYSQVWTASNAARQAYKPYPKILADLCGADYEILAYPGDSASDAWARNGSNIVAKTNALAIVYLGTNEGLTDTLAEDAPENTSYTTWADTNTGCYAKWVAKLQENGYKVMLVGVFSGDVATTNSVIQQIATRFGCAYLPSYRNTDLKYHYWPNLQGSNNGHYNDLGYAWFASVMPYKVSQLDDDNLKYIVP